MVYRRSIDTLFEVDGGAAMTREEAIKILSNRDTHGMPCGYTGGYTEALDMAIEALDERKVELFDDGTLVVNVKEGEKVGRVLIDGDDHFGGLYYIDAEPVKHGEWKYHNYSNISNKYQGYFICSVCGYHEHTKHYFCPNCGAKMDKE